MNTITKAVSTMKLAGIDIDTEKFEDEEFINYTKTNVVLQVSTAMQAQANALPDMVLKILNN